MLPRLLEEGIGVIGMKPMADGRIVNDRVGGGVPAVRDEPAGERHLTGCDSLERVEQALRVATGFQPLAEEAVTSLLSRTEPRGLGGASEPYKTKQEYDGTVQSPSWLE